MRRRGYCADGKDRKLQHNADEINITLQCALSLDGEEPDFKSALVIEERLFPNLEKKNRHNRKIRIYTQKKQYK